MVGVVGIANRGWGAVKKIKEVAKRNKEVAKRNKESKQLFKLLDPDVKLQHPVIKSVKPAKNLTERKKSVDDLVGTINKQYEKAGVKPGSSGSKIKKKFWKKSSDIQDKHEKAISDVKKYNKNLKMKVIGAGGAAGAAIGGAHVTAKKKFPKYKKFAESDIKTVDGKLKLVPRKKK